MKKMIDENNLEWFPRLRTMSIDVEEKEDEKKEISAMRKEMTELSATVNELKKQISELTKSKEPVMKFSRASSVATTPKRNLSFVKT